jgi:hypothetical protein
MQAIDQSAGRGLSQDASDPTDSEGDAYALLIPAITSQVYCEERSDPNLHVGQEEIQPVQAAPGLAESWPGLSGRKGAPRDRCSY